MSGCEYKQCRRVKVDTMPLPGSLLRMPFRLKASKEPIKVQANGNNNKKKVNNMMQK